MADDLFGAMDDLFRGRRVESPPSDFVLNRFLASQREAAPFARALSRDVRDTAMAWEVWRAALPRAPRAPRMPYPAPKRQPDAEHLVAALMEREGMSRTHAEDAVSVLEAGDMVDRAAATYGVEDE